MTPARRGARWDLFGSMDMVASLWSPRSVSNAMSASWGAGYRTLFDTVRKRILGRTVTVRYEHGEIKALVTEIEAPLDPVALSVGQLGRVAISGENVTWNGRRLPRAAVTLHNVHLRPGATPVLVSAPVELNAELTPEVCEELLARAAPRLAGALNADGVAEIRLARWRNLGAVAVAARVDGATLWLRPHGVIVRHRRFGLPHGMPAIPIRLPALPNDAVI